LNKQINMQEVWLLTISCAYEGLESIEGVFSSEELAIKAHQHCVENITSDSNCGYWEYAIDQTDHETLIRVKHNGMNWINDKIIKISRFDVDCSNGT